MCNKFYPISKTHREQWSRMWWWKPVSAVLKNLKCMLCSNGGCALGVEMEVGPCLAGETSNAMYYALKWWWGYHSLWHHGAKPLLTKQDNAPQREHPPVQQHRLHVTALWVETKDSPTSSFSLPSGLILQPINPQAGLLCGAEAAVLIMLKCACVIRLGGGQESRDSVPGCWHQSSSRVYSQLAWGPQKQNIISFCACILLMLF